MTFRKTFREQLDEFLRVTGPTAMPAIYGHFNLVGKRTIDDELVRMVADGDARRAVGGIYSVTKKSIKDEILGLFDETPLTVADMATALPHRKRQSLAATVARLVGEGELTRLERGVYALRGPYLDDDMPDGDAHEDFEPDDIVVTLRLSKSGGIKGVRVGDAEWSQP